MGLASGNIIGTQEKINFLLNYLIFKLTFKAATRSNYRNKVHLLSAHFLLAS